MAGFFNNTRAPGWFSRRLRAALRGWMVLAVVAAVGAPAALGQTPIKVQFLASPTQSEAAAKAGAHPMDTNSGPGPVVGSPGYFVGTETVNSAGTQQVSIAFLTFSDLSTYVPAVRLQYGKNYSVGAANCMESAAPVSTGYAYEESCTATVTFTPLYPGGHKDALLVLGTDGQTEIGGEFLYGIGLAPQLMIQPGATSSVSLPGNPYMYGDATDDAGTYYVYANSDFYTVKNGSASLLASAVGRGYNLSVDGAGNIFDQGSGSSGGYEFEQAANGAAEDARLCYSTEGDATRNPVIVAYTVCFDNPVVVTTGNLGTYYDADGGGELAENNTQYSHGIIVQSYGTQYPVSSPPPPEEQNGIYGAGGDQPLPYPLDGGNYSPSQMVVDPYENLFLLDQNYGMAVWCGFGQQGLSSALTGSSNGCGGWGASMVGLNQITNGGPMAVDAADTLYVPQSYNGNIAIWQYSASNNYATPITDIGVYNPGAVALAPDGTVYVPSNSAVEVMDRSRGSIDFGSNNGAVNNPYTMTLYNGGNEPLTVASIAASGAGYSIAPTATNGCTNGVVIATGTICQLKVSFSQAHGGTSAGGVAIISNSLNNASAMQSIVLSAEVSGIYVTASPNPLDVGYVPPGQVGTTAVTLINASVGSNSVGYGSTTYVNGSFSSNNPAFSASAGTCSTPEAAGGPNCQIEVAFNPSLAQTYSGTITWTESIGGGPSQQMSLAVSGTGINPVIPYADSETIHITDMTLLTPSTLFGDMESIHITDQLSLASSTLLPVEEVIHVADVEDLGGTVFSNATTTSLSAAQTLVSAGSGVLLTAMVTEAGTSTSPPGSVNLFMDGNAIGSGTMSGGVATFVSPALSAGTHEFQAVYPATENLTGSSSGFVAVNAVTQTVLTVTANNAARNFDAVSRAFTYGITNSAGGSLPTITGAPTLTTTATRNSAAGSYPIVASMGTLSAPSGYEFAFVNGVLTVSGATAQTITFLPFPNLPLIGVHSLAMTAHSTSGLAISYSVTGPAAVSGNTVSISGSGLVTVTASQAGNSTFAAAAPVAESFTVIQ
jgi:hypothetical protein